MGKLAFRPLVAHCTTVRPRKGRGLIHAFGPGVLDKTVCGRRTIGWIVTAERTTGRYPTIDSLTCKKCQEGCR